MPKPSPNLDDLLNVEDASRWLGLSEREVLEKSKGRSPKILGYWINQRVVRFHPRAVLAKMAKDNGAPAEFIASMFGECGKAIKSIVVAISLASLFTLSSSASPSDEQIANAIRKTEGVWTYGIKTITVTNEAHARRICLNTIRNNRVRWQRSGSSGSFIEFLADRYCPKSVDLVGNANWKRNMNFFLLRKCK